MEGFIFFEFSKERVIFSYVIKLCSQLNVSDYKKSFYSLTKNSKNMMCIGVADDMPTLHNDIEGVIFLKIAFTISYSNKNLHYGYDLLDIHYGMVIFFRC